MSLGHQKKGPPLASIESLLSFEAKSTPRSENNAIIQEAANMAAAANMTARRKTNANFRRITDSILQDAKQICKTQIKRQFWKFSR